MFSLLLFCSLQTASVSTQQAPAQVPNDSITIFGICADISTGVDLRATTFAVIKGEKHRIGQSNEDGKFDFQILTSTDSLAFEMKGFRPTTLPVNILGETRKGDRFPVMIRMISLDSLQVLTPYQQNNNRRITTAASSQKKEVKTYFIVKDAYSGESVKSKICLTNGRTGRTKCTETNGTKLSIPIILERDSQISLRVTADGFQSYSADLMADNNNDGDLLCQIKLLQTHNPLALYIDGPDSLDMKYLMGSKDHWNREFDFKKGQHQKDVHLDYFGRSPDFRGTHRIIAITGAKRSLGSDDLGLNAQIEKVKSEGATVLLDESFTALAGLNFKSIHVDVLTSAMVKADALAPTSDSAIPFDKRTLYFDQSSYLMRRETKLTLDSISEFLMKQRNAKAHLTGHTDHVGKRDLNMALSEYRARVVATYLRGKGVPDQQIIMDWKGPDMPAASSDSNIVKNRRVEVRVLQNGSL